MTNQNILPEKPLDAVKLITKTVKELLDVMEQEGRAMISKDGVSFTAAQEEKTRLSGRYEQMNEEFKQRILDFRSVDRAYLDQLDAAQRELAEKTKENMAALDRMSASSSGS